MQVELYCPSCACRFGAASDTPFDEVLDRMVDEGPWFGLAEGQTFADMIAAALSVRGVIRCPECQDAVALSGHDFAPPVEQLACSFTAAEGRPGIAQVPRSDCRSIATSGTLRRLSR